jgi:hypothetical protein
MGASYRGDEDVVCDQLDPFAERVGQQSMLNTSSS